MIGATTWARDPRAAIADLEECLSKADETTLNVIWFSSLGYLARCYAVVGDHGKAIEAVRRSVLVARDRGAAGTFAQALDYGGQALVTMSHDLEGATFLGAVEGGRVARRTLGGLLLDERLAAEETARDRLGDDAYDEAVRAGAALTMETALVYALEVLDRLDSASG